VKKSKIEEVFEDVKKVESIEWHKVEKDKMVHATFYIKVDELEKLKEYANQVSPRHIKVSLSMMIRYMIETFDLDKAKRDFFKA